MLPAHNLPPPSRTHGSDLYAKKSHFTFIWPISRYRRATRATSFPGLCAS